MVKQRSLCIFVLLFYTSFTQARENREKPGRSFILIPGFIHLEGVGGIYGVGGGVRHLHEGRIDILGGAAFGDNKGYGLLGRDIPVGIKNTGLSLFGAEVQKATYINSYTRGPGTDSPVRQTVKGRGYGTGLEYLTMGQKLILSGSLVSSSVGFAGYEDTDGRAISLPGAFLPDVETLSLILKGTLKSHPEPVTNELNWTSGLELKADTGRTGQADQLTTTLDISTSRRLISWLEPAGRVRLSSASILKRQSKYETREGVLEALKTDCDTLSGEERSACEKLRDELADYIAANNRYGTAKPAGGASGVRGYREFQFKGAHTRILTLESRFILSEFMPGDYFRRKENDLALVFFADYGFNADKASDLYKKHIKSRGLSLRATLNKAPLRLTLARTDQDTVWFFTAGFAF